MSVPATATADPEGGARPLPQPQSQSRSQSYQSHSQSHTQEHYPLPTPQSQDEDPSQAQDASELRLRKNGKQQSCEPCRLSKTRCNHESPCSRCVRQGKKCYFHPAPMTRPKSDVKAPKSSDGTLSNGAGSSVKSPASSGVASLKRKRSTVPLVTPNTETSTISSYATVTPKLSLSYAGPTAHVAIFSENKMALGEAWDDTMPPPEAVKGGIARDPRLMKIAIDALAWLPSEALAKEIVCPKIRDTGPYYSGDSHGGAVRTEMATFHIGFWSTFGKLLEQPRSSENLTKIAYTLSANTANPLPIPRSTDEWLKSISGPQSRWELVSAHSQYNPPC
ncbi:hypothetical protein MRB53_037559 [Persea americana]|nr:hypothetical protein MRB53_037559 [Persea americana]